MMDEFEKWRKANDADMKNDVAAHGVFGVLRWIRKAWQESAKQKDVEIDGLNAIIGQQDEIIENLEMSVRSFTNSNVDIAEKERKRIIEEVSGWKYELDALVRNLISLIEKV